jgi:hypothetical protein
LPDHTHPAGERVTAEELFDHLERIHERPMERIHERPIPDGAIIRAMYNHTRLHRVAPVAMGNPAAALAGSTPTPDEGSEPGPSGNAQPASPVPSHAHDPFFEPFKWMPNGPWTAAMLEEHFRLHGRELLSFSFIENAFRWHHAQHHPAGARYVTGDGWDYDVFPASHVATVKDRLTGDIVAKCPDDSTAQRVANGLAALDGAFGTEPDHADVEDVLAVTLHQLDPQETGVRTKAERLAEALREAGLLRGC